MKLLLTMEIAVKNLTGKDFNVELKPDATVVDLKRKIVETDSNLSYDRLILCLHGNELPENMITGDKDELRLSTFGPIMEVYIFVTQPTKNGSASPDSSSTG